MVLHGVVSQDSKVLLTTILHSSLIEEMWYLPTSADAADYKVLTMAQFPTWRQISGMYTCEACPTTWAPAQSQSPVS